MLQCFHEYLFLLRRHIIYMFITGTSHVEVIGISGGEIAGFEGREADSDGVEGFQEVVDWVGVESKEVLFG
jgi:hypothetical protein